MPETRQRGMGRGLAAILSAAPREVGDDLREVPVELVEPNPNQPRERFEDEALVALADSLRERGVLQPVLVRPLPSGRYELIAGERRWRAARMAGLETVPALVRPHDDAASLELAVIENMAREDLSPVEEARACAALVEELGLTREEVGRRVGRSRVAVSNLMRLLDLPDEALELLAAGDLTEGHGRALLLADGHDVRRRLARRAAAEDWTVRRTEDEARAAAAGPGAAARQGRPGASRTGPAPRALHPDEAEALERVAEALTAATGAAVEVVRKGGGYEARLPLGSLEEALGLLERLVPARR